MFALVNFSHEYCYQYHSYERLAETCNKPPSDKEVKLFAEIVSFQNIDCHFSQKQ